MLGIALAGLQLELGGTYLLSQDVSIAGRDAAVGLLQLTTADAAVCYRVLRRPFVAPCLLGELGRLAAKGLNLPQFEDRTLLWLAVGASARLGVDIARWLRWQTEIAAALPWDHAHFGVRDLGSVHRIPAVIGRLSVGLEGSF
jgi:hypothetical protein